MERVVIVLRSDGGDEYITYYRGDFFMLHFNVFRVEIFKVYYIVCVCGVRLNNCVLWSQKLIRSCVRLHTTDVFCGESKIY